MKAMTTGRPDMTTTTETEAEQLAAKREERQGWLMLTAIFAGGGILVAIAAIAT
jgi:hypothetical protein